MSCISAWLSGKATKRSKKKNFFPGCANRLAQESETNEPKKMLKKFQSLAKKLKTQNSNCTTPLHKKYM
jgi:hypothetical protein